MIIHVPLVNKRNMMDLYEYRPMPIRFNEDNDTNYIINPVKNVIGINTEGTLYKEYSSDELLYKCNKIGNFLYCSDDSILRKADSVDCLLALYNRNIKRIGSSCDIEVTNQEHFSIQLNDRTFLTYNKEATLLSIYCIDSTGKESNLFSGHPK